MKELLKIELQCGLKPTPEQKALIEQYIGKEIKLNQDGSISWSDRDLVITLDEALSLGCKFEVTSRTKIARFEDVVAEVSQQAIRAEAPVNERCNVVVAGTAVVSITQVTLEKDCCTDHLQTRLNEGWRILAICVQPDQRRPDYILGKL